MVLNFEALRSGNASYADIVGNITHADLYKLTDEFFATIESIIASVTDTDTTFVPHDLNLKDSNEQAYTLGHVIVHLTAACEEASSSGSALARGIAFEGRLRYEVAWETIHTAQQVYDRLKESHRMCRAFLDTWPDAPRLAITIVRVPRFGPMNAIGLHMLGIFHGESHVEQLHEILWQAKAQV
ncbi:MAG: DinB family protein [Ktedonobacteraceae bacterium]